MAAPYWNAEPLRHECKDLHLGQMRSPAHALLNRRRQARQLRTLESMSPSGTGFLSLIEAAFSARSGIHQRNNQASRVCKLLLSNSCRKNARRLGREGNFAEIRCP